MLGSFLFESARYSMTPEGSSISEVEVVAEFDQEARFPSSVLSTTTTWNQTVLESPVVAESFTSSRLELETLWEFSSAVITRPSVSFQVTSVFGQSSQLQNTQFETGELFESNPPELTATTTLESSLVGLEMPFGSVTFSTQSIDLGGESHSFFEQRELTIETPFSVLQVSRTESSPSVVMEETFALESSLPQTSAGIMMDKTSIQSSVSINRTSLTPSVDLAFEESATIAGPNLRLERSSFEMSMGNRSLNLMQSRQELGNLAVMQSSQLTLTRESSLDSLAFLV